MGKSLVIRIRKVLFQTFLGAWLGLGVQPHYETPGDKNFRVKNVKT